MDHTLDRRRQQRTRTSTRYALERALASWKRLRVAWTTILGAAHTLENQERVALAEAKLEECRVQIIHLESMLARLGGE